MKKLTILVIALFVLTMAAPVFAGPFSDVRAGHWAYEAVKTLAARGVLEGYPNNKFDGNKVMTRYEVAQMVARLLEVHGIGGDYSTLQKLTIEFADELALLGVKVTALEDEVRAIRMDQEDMKAKLDHMGMGKIRVTAEARVRFEQNKNDNALGANNNFLRFRLNMSALIDENVSAYFSFQDDSLLNSNTQNNNGTTVAGTGTGNLNRNMFLGYVDIKNFGTIVDNFRFGRQTYTLGKGFILDNELDGMLVRKDYRGTIFQFGAFDTSAMVTTAPMATAGNDGLNFQTFSVDHAWENIAAGAYYVSYDAFAGTAVLPLRDATIFGLTLDAKLARNVVAYLEYVSEDFDVNNEEADAYKLGVEWTINKYYDLSVLYQERENDFSVLGHNDDYTDSMFYSNDAINGTIGETYNNSKIVSVIFGAKLRDDLQLDLWYEDFEQKDNTAVATATTNAKTATYGQTGIQAIVTYQYRDNTSFKLRYRTVEYDDGSTNYKGTLAGGVATGATPADYDQVRLDMNVKF